MSCRIYRSDRLAYTYLYLAEGKELADLPEALHESFGSAEFVMELDLAQRTRLAQANIEIVKASLQAQGFYLQLPPELSVEDLLEQRFNR
jgi:uncharacterized protein YcgL (UPF0745 family)